MRIRTERDLTRDSVARNIRHLALPLGGAHSDPVSDGYVKASEGVMAMPGHRRGAD